MSLDAMEIALALLSLEAVAATRDRPVAELEARLVLPSAVSSDLHNKAAHTRIHNRN